jgi:two-component system KDP operon response regulator KdpE
MPGLVLVVDDDVTLRRSLCEALEEAGYNAVSAASGGDAREWLTHSNVRPDLILLDLGLPGISGATFAGWLRSHGRFNKLPFLVISGLPDAEATAKQIGAASCLKKPFKPDALLEAVDAHRAA